MMIKGEYTMNGEQWIVHPEAMVKKKKIGCCRSDVGYVAAGSSHFGGQAPLLSSMSVRLVCVPCLVFKWDKKT